MKKRYDTVAIVGVGLIGGSIGLALRERGLARHVIGIGRRAASLNVARRRGAISLATLDLAQGVASAEVVVVCTPVDGIAQAVEDAAAAAHAGALLTDAGSTKAGIVASLDGRLPRASRFVGSHPLAGGDQSGPKYAQADLFERRTVIITPTSRTPAADRRDVARFWSVLGARTVEMSPEQHDRAVAATSHLPHLAAAALAAATPRALLKLVAAGWLDTTRVAAGDVDLWLQILRANRSDVLKSLGEFEKVMASLHDALESGDDRRLAQLLTQAKRNRDAVGS